MLLRACETMSTQNSNHCLTRHWIQLQCCVNNLSLSCFNCLMLYHAAATVTAIFNFGSGDMYICFISI